jgi:dihydrofolate synthase/folylpolyglutamate synthase
VTVPSVPDALSRIVAHTPDARVLICGSLYLAGAVLALDPEA